MRLDASLLSEILTEHDPIWRLFHFNIFSISSTIAPIEEIEV